VKGDNPELKLWEIGKIIGQMWRDLADDQKQEYIEAFEAEKVEYNDSLKSYHNSPAYQSWISAKAKAQRVLDDHNRQTPAHDRHTTNLLGFPSPQKQSEGKVCLQSADDDDDCDEFSVKHLATARYQRNHRLINEIFSDSIVPDVRSVVTNARMQVLKRQVQSLTMHQKKLEAELQQIEEKFVHKKRKFVEASDQFKEEVRKKCATKAVDANTFRKMVDKALDQLKKEHALREEQMISNKTADKVDKMETESQENIVDEVPLEAPEATLPETVTESQHMSTLEESQEPKEETQNTDIEMETEAETVDHNKELITATTDSNSGFASNDSQQTDTNETNSEELVKESLKAESEPIEESNDLPQEESTETPATQ